MSLPVASLTRRLTLDNNQLSQTTEFFSGFGLPTALKSGISVQGNLAIYLEENHNRLRHQLGRNPGPSFSIIVQDGAGNRWQKPRSAMMKPRQFQPPASPSTGGTITNRGNLTTLGRWLNSNGSTLNTFLTYDDTGNVLTFTDPGGHQTQFSYADNFSDGMNRNSLAYITQVTLPDTSSPALAHHVTHTQYEPNSGQPSTSTDQNSRNTTFAYDLMLRPLAVTLPDGGQTSFIYDSTTQMHTQTKIDASRSSVAYVQVDSYGRKSRTALANNESSPFDQQDFCYDSNGRLKFQSYTYQNTGFNSPIVCSGAGDTFSYDALGRATQVTHSDGTSIQTSYTGRAQQVTDEGNGSYFVSRVLQSDALGRLTSVCEVSNLALLGSGGTPAGCGQDIAATGFLTTYAYDTLNNFTSISQGGSLPSRTFGYDSLSRLTSETEPEWGTGSTMTYGYNSDSLLSSRVRPAPNQTNPAVSVTTNYVYDALHRLTGRTYAGDATGTPAATFNYDESSPLGLVTSINPIGRLTSELSGNTKSALSYDPVGRVVSNWQCTPLFCPANTLKLLSYQYDLAGDMVSGSNGAGVTLSYAYNAAPRLTGITSSYVDAQHPATLLSNAHYGPFGLLNTRWATV